MKILITGGAGFIGSHVVRLMVNKYPKYSFTNLDKLTYAGNLNNIADIENASNYKFCPGDICDRTFILELFETEKFDAVLHLAAESHVDRSILNPLEFVNTNILGTINLLDAARQSWSNANSNASTAIGRNVFFHISTDEVYGSLGKEGKFVETTPYDPRSPYSAAKASSDHFVSAYYHTFGLPVVVSNCSNNYGPNQFPEKLIPLVINNISHMKPIPVYGKGDNIRDWLYVEDHAKAIDIIFHHGRLGQTYNIGGLNEWTNIDLIKLICSIMDEKLNRPGGTSEGLISFVKDRLGHDQRYAMDAQKLMDELGWKPEHSFEKGIELTIDWYLQNKKWLDDVTSGAYQDYYNELYK